MLGKKCVFIIFILFVFDEADLLQLHWHFLWFGMQRTFLEQRPQLRRVVDFVVDTAAGNAARAAVLKLVPPALQSAQEKLQVCIQI